MSAREIIAQWILRYADREARAGNILADLSAAGYRILGPGGLDAETLERAAEVAESHIAEPGLSDNPAYVRFSPADAMSKKIAAAIRSLKLEGGGDE